ncbi:MAG: GNAT family N-acetyltransferase [Agrobacterium fabrum]|uniref:GNAT family N-acetyltransferase n=1 Tax=Agrobacterium fabrum TaxID=1176649 RepID=A0A2W5FI37_9HYPH|nr:MAG: GNAT family N-acetyltransferase [Agrobacterium fabrum]
MSMVRLEQIANNDDGLKAALIEAHLPADDIEDQGRIFFKAASADGSIVGFSGVEACLGDYLLRSVVVLAYRRGEGLGRAVVNETLASLGRHGDVFVATTSAASFFASIGFSDVPRDSVPAAVLATRQLSSICPSSATIMKLIKPPT